MSESFVEFTMPEKRDEKEPWNCMKFIGCKVMKISTSSYSSGERLSLEICAPKLKKKFFLFAWSDSPVYSAIMNSNLQTGDEISVYTEMAYYKKNDKDGNTIYQEAYQIVPNWDFQGETENPGFFKLMYIKREEAAQHPEKNSSPYMSKEELLQKMIG